MKKIIIFAALLAFGSCSLLDPNYCPKPTPARVQKWEHTHKFRVMWYRHEGPFYVVRFENELRSFNKIYDGCLPDSIKVGKWIEP